MTIKLMGKFIIDMSYVGVSIGSNQTMNLKYIDTGQFPIALLGGSVFMLRYWQLSVGTGQIGS